VADGYAGGELLAEVIRSGFVEGYHRGSVVVLDARGEAMAAAGDVTGPLFPRSSNKPLQAVGMLRAGLRLPEASQLAMAAASHLGEPRHIELVRTMLGSAGLTEEALACPPGLPIAVPARDAVLRAGGGPERVYMNCSGKHTGMLLTCLAVGWPTEGYVEPAHPLQVHIRSVIEELAGEPVAAVGVDGCGAPVFALSLYALARMFLGLVGAAPGTPSRDVADAMRGYPELMSGTGALDVRVMTSVPGALAKSGAEGVQAVAVPGLGAVALKVDDGAERGRLPVLVAALRRLGVPEQILVALGEEPVLGGGRQVGVINPIW
jgi:L-asparaginase II